MVKRAKRLVKGIESLKKEIESHFKKVETDIIEGNINRGKYHIKEIDKSLLKALEIKIQALKLNEDNSINLFKKKLDKLKNKLES